MKYQKSSCVRIASIQSLTIALASSSPTISASERRGKRVKRRQNLCSLEESARAANSLSCGEANMSRRAIGVSMWSDRSILLMPGAACTRSCSSPIRSASWSNTRAYTYRYKTRFKQLIKLSGLELRAFIYTSSLECLMCSRKALNSRFSSNASANERLIDTWE